MNDDAGFSSIYPTGLSTDVSDLSFRLILDDCDEKSSGHSFGIEAIKTMV